MTDETLAVYEDNATGYEANRSPVESERAGALAALVEPGSGPILDIGTGPGWYLPFLGPGAIGLDGAEAMLTLARSLHAPGHRLVRADLSVLPFRRGSLGGAWSSRSHVHVDRRLLPMALAELHRCLAVDSPIELTLFEGDADHVVSGDDEFPGRRYAHWNADHLVDVLVGAGFGRVAVRVEPRTARGAAAHLLVSARRLRSLPDTVAPGMRVLFCGLNPSLHAARVGIGYIGPGNRFWPALAAAGLHRGRPDPVAALVEHGIGMTDLVKRATARAGELDRTEFVDGLARVERLVRWLRPGAVCMVGLSGWRAAVDRSARAGPAGSIAGRPVWVMPSTSGINTHTSLGELVEHVRSAAALA